MEDEMCSHILQQHFKLCSNSHDHVFCTTFFKPDEPEPQFEPELLTLPEGFISWFSVKHLNGWKLFPSSSCGSETCCDNNVLPAASES